jgi:hypothetical protein
MSIMNEDAKPLKDELKNLEDRFSENVDNVNKLTKLDDDVLVFCIERLKQVKRFLKDQGIQENHQSCNVAQILHQIENIRENESLKPRYKAMLNQCVVLLVSYFASAIHDIFCLSLSEKIKRGDKIEKLEGKEALRLPASKMAELYAGDFSEIGELLAEQKQISFQDMKSICDALRDYIGYEHPEDKDIHNIILAHACRHTLVHAGGIVSEKTANQLERAKLRDIQQLIHVEQHLQFNTADIVKIGDSMKIFINEVVAKI